LIDIPQAQDFVPGLANDSSEPIRHDFIGLLPKLPQHNDQAQQLFWVNLIDSLVRLIAPGANTDPITLLVAVLRE
jgi:hypothetical protein